MRDERTATWVPGEVTNLVQLRALVAQLEYAGFPDDAPIVVQPLVHGDGRFVRGAVIIND